MHIGDGEIHVSIKTANRHGENIKAKQGPKNAAELARAALRWSGLKPAKKPDRSAALAASPKSMVPGRRAEDAPASLIVPATNG